MIKTNTTGLKIVIVQGAFLPVPPKLGGAVEKIWYKMGHEFAASGHEVVHISRSYPGLPGEEFSDGVKYIRVKGYDTPAKLFKLKWLDLLYSLRAIKKIPECDVIITNTFWLPFLLRGKRGRKVYVDVQRVPRGQMKFYKHVGMLRGCSPSIYEAVKAELPLGSHDIVSYVPNPVPFTVRQLNMEKEKTILFVGRLHPEKGVDVLLQAYDLLSDELKQKWKLQITGPSDFKDGGGGEQYLEELKALAKGNNIAFTGPVYNEGDLVTYYAKAGIFCYPSQDWGGDAAPVAPREAMAYGCVPLVSDVACFNDLVIEGKNGLKFDQNASDQPKSLAEKLKKLASDEVMLKRMAAECKKVNESFSPGVIAEAFINDFRKIKQYNS